MLLISPVHAITNGSDESDLISDLKTSNIHNHSIKIFDSNVGAIVTKNPEIRKNIPQTSFSKKILKYQKKGSTIIKFGNGNGLKLLIWAGIHGNEEEANIAAMKYVEYLKRKNFNGTIYVIPFAIPKSTALNSRKYRYVKYTYKELKYKKLFKVKVKKILQILLLFWK